MEQRFPRSFLEKTSFMDLDHLQAKVRKYEILARFPGRAGRIYKERLADRKSLVEVYMAFNEALNQCSQMIHIDIGANVGTVTRIMAQSASKVFAFEPDPWAFSRLTQATESLGNVTLLNAAAGVSDGDVRLFRSESFDSDPQIHSAASSVFKSQYSDSDNSFLVKQVDIVEFLMEMGDIGIVKIDAEGAEVPILESILGNKSLANRIGYIFAELHEALFPELSARYNALRDRCNALPHVNLNWP